MTRHFLDLSDLAPGVLQDLVDTSRRLKAERRTEAASRPLDGKYLAMIFEKPSTRTRVSFDVGMRDLGGETVVLTGGEMQLGRGETIADTARVLSRYVDAIMIRALDHTMVTDLAANATIPVINGLTRFSHPCQVVADVMTYEEHRGSIAGKKVAWLGDSNNVLTSWIHAAAHLDFSITVGAPSEFAPAPEIRAWATEHGVTLNVTDSADEAAADADCIVTDTWVSMGDEDGDRRREVLGPYQVDEALMAKAASDALFMHCLPAHREEEVSTAVIDGSQSVVFDEAENRLHAQKGILLWCLGDAAT